MSFKISISDSYVEYRYPLKVGSDNSIQGLYEQICELFECPVEIEKGKKRLQYRQLQAENEKLRKALEKIIIRSEQDEFMLGGYVEISDIAREALK